MIKVAVFLTFLAAIAPCPSYAKPEMFVMSGICTKMTAAGIDRTDDCGNKLVSATLDNGRVTFAFTIGDDRVTTFAGSGSRQRKLGRKAIQPIDHLDLYDAKNGSKRFSAVGACTYGSPFTGKTTVACRAGFGKIIFVAEFITDGSPPTTSR